jgi:phosphoglycerate dehydrogenase-like enzyme
MRVWLPYSSIEEARSRLGSWSDGIEIDVVNERAIPTQGAEEVVLLGLPNFAANKVYAMTRSDDMPNLKWVQLASAGYEHIIGQIPEHVGVCNAAGVHDAGTSELGIGLALASLRHLDKYAVDRLSHRFDPVYSDSLADKRVLIVGYGHVGSAVERRLAGFEVASITRVARTARQDPDVHAVHDLPELVGDADVVFLCLPGSEETTHIVDADLMSRMHDGTLIINIGRGVMMDLDALLAENGRIRAAVDVTDPEPLPPDHPLWDADFVTWAPHVGGQCSAGEPRYDALIHRQLDRLVTDQPLLNVVRSPK